MAEAVERVAEAVLPVKRVPGEYGFSDQLPEDLAEGVVCWDGLPDTV